MRTSSVDIPKVGSDHTHPIDTNAGDDGPDTDVRPVGVMQLLSFLWAVVAVVAILLWSMVYWQRAHTPPGRLHDLVQGWTSARNHLEGQPVYRPMADSVGEYIGPKAVPLLEEVTLNAHPPGAVLLTLPFAHLPYHEAYRLWTLTMLVPLALSLVLLFAPGGLPHTAIGVLTLLAMLLSSSALAQQTLQGQLNIVLLLMVVAAWRLDRADSSFGSGLCIGLAGGIKLFPCFLGLYFLARRDWKGVSGTFCGVVAINVVAAAVLGVQAFQDYVSIVIPHLSRFRDQWGNLSISGWLARILNAPSGSVEVLLDAPVLAGVLWLAAVAVLVGLCGSRAMRAESRPERDLAFSLCIVGAILASPIAWNHYLVLLVLPLSVCFVQSGTAGRAFLIALSVLLCTVELKWIWDAAGLGPEQRYLGGPPIASLGQTLTLLSYQTYCLIALFAYVGLAAACDEHTESDVLPSESPTNRFGTRP